VGLVLTFRLVFGQRSSDFDQLVIGARRVMHGETPYTLSPLPGLEWPIFYPMPAIVFAVPFSYLSPAVSQAVFCGLTTGLCAWGLSKDGEAKLFSFATWSYVLSVSLGQWGPALMAAATIPALGWLVIAKPNVGAAIAAGYLPLWFRGRALAVNLSVGALLLIASFWMRPTWLTEWRAVLSLPTPHLIVPLSIFGGPLLLLALLRWRRPEARMLAVLACVPQTFSSYDSLILFLVVRTRREALFLAACSLIVTAYVAVVGVAPTYAETVHRFAPVRLWLLYLPMVALILTRRNEFGEGAAPLPATSHPKIDSATLA
jgi:hypothetical protein